MARSRTRIDSPTTRIASTVAATPDCLYQVPSPQRALRPSRPLTLYVSNIAGVSTGATAQAFIGVRFASGSGGADWEPVFAPVLNPGDSVSIDLTTEMAEGDEVVCRCDVTNVVNVTTEIGTL